MLKIQFVKKVVLRVLPLLHPILNGLKNVRVFGILGKTPKQVLQKQMCRVLYTKIVVLYLMWLKLLLLIRLLRISLLLLILSNRFSNLLVRRLMSLLISSSLNASSLCLLQFWNNFQITKIKWCRAWRILPSNSPSNSIL